LHEESPHAWWVPLAASVLGTTLLQIGQRAEAVAQFEHGCRLADQEGAQAYLLRCLAPLAAASGSSALLAEADAMLGASVNDAPRLAWLTVDSTYINVAPRLAGAARAGAGAAILAPMLAAARRVPWVAPLAEGSLVDGLAARALGNTAEAHDLLRTAAELGGRHQLAYVAREADAAQR